MCNAMDGGTIEDLMPSAKENGKHCDWNLIGSTVYHYYDVLFSNMLMLIDTKGGAAT